MRRSVGAGYKLYLGPRGALVSSVMQPGVLSNKRRAARRAAEAAGTGLQFSKGELEKPVAARRKRRGALDTELVGLEARMKKDKLLWKRLKRERGRL